MTAILRDFLEEILPRSQSGLLIDNTSEDLHDYVNDNFDLLSEGVLRKLVEKALSVRDENVKLNTSMAQEDILGVWGQIVDVVRDVTSSRQERAGTNFQAVVAIAQKEGPKKTSQLLTQLYKKGEIDNLFQELLKDAIERSKAIKSKESTEMLEFFDKVIQKNKDIEVALKNRDSTNSSNHSSSVPDTYSNNSNPAKQEEHVKEVVIDTANMSLEEHSNMEAGSDSDDEAIIENEEEYIQQQVMKEVQQIELQESESEQEKLMHASAYLRKVIDESRGDAVALQKRLQKELTLGFGDFTIDHFEKVVQDTLLASEQAGYVNKVKLLQFIINRCITPVVEALKDSVANKENQGAIQYDLDGNAIAGDGSTSHHAPKFVDDLLNSGKDAKTFKVISPQTFVAGFAKSSASSKKLSKTGQLIDSNNKHKESARNFTIMASKLATHLKTHGWAVCDDFISSDIVRRVRIEAGLFEEHYEQSEIWVGKQADVGTLLSVPSVRGDKVIWMCGGHDHKLSPEGMSRVVKTKNEIEPCKLEAKARAPMRKFNALKELVKACDNLVDELKTKVESCSGIYERSDAMLANYPGGGSRFARHIDNTTNDGRRLTLLIYLNPGWKPEQGGALRLTPLSKFDAKSKSNINSNNKDDSIVDENELNYADAIDVLPDCGRLAMFYSADIPHEVMPTYGDRHAITLWYYDSKERAQAVEDANKSGKAAEVNKAGVDAQREAKQFIADLMGNDADDNAEDPSQQELNALTNKVVDMSPSALGVVASITGAPSADSFKEGFPMLTPSDLKHMRQLFRRMGLNE